MSSGGRDKPSALGGTTTAPSLTGSRHSVSSSVVRPSVPRPTSAHELSRQGTSSSHHQNFFWPPPDKPSRIFPMGSYEDIWAHRSSFFSMARDHFQFPFSPYQSYSDRTTRSTESSSSSSIQRISSHPYTQGPSHHGSQLPPHFVPYPTHSSSLRSSSSTGESSGRPSLFSHHEQVPASHLDDTGPPGSRHFQAPSRPESRTRLEPTSQGRLQVFYPSTESQRSSTQFPYCSKPSVHFSPSLFSVPRPIPSSVIPPDDPSSSMIPFLSRSLPSSTLLSEPFPFSFVGSHQRRSEFSSDPEPSTSTCLASSQRPHYPPHFRIGSVIQLGTGRLKRVEDLQTEDFLDSALLSQDLKIDSSIVVHMRENHEHNTVILGFSVGEEHIQVTVEATLEHPFFVYNQGWSSCSPERTLQQYGLQCHQLAIGNPCISITQRDTRSVLPSASATSRPPFSSTEEIGLQQPSHLPTASTVERQHFSAEFHSNQPSTPQPPPQPLSRESTRYFDESRSAPVQDLLRPRKRRCSAPDVLDLKSLRPT